MRLQPEPLGATSHRGLWAAKKGLFTSHLDLFYFLKIKFAKATLLNFVDFRFFFFGFPENSSEPSEENWRKTSEF